MKSINFQSAGFLSGTRNDESNPNSSLTTTHKEPSTKKVQKLLETVQYTALILKQENSSQLGLENANEVYKKQLSWIFNEYQDISNEQTRRSVKELFQNLFTQYSDKNTLSVTSAESPTTSIKPNELSALVRAQRAAESADYLAKCFKLDENDKEKEIWQEKKISSLQKASDMGDAEAKHLLGKLLYKKAIKNTVSKSDFQLNITKAVEYISQSAIQSKKGKYLSCLQHMCENFIGDKASDDTKDLIITKILRDLSQKPDEVGEEVAGAAANYLACFYSPIINNHKDAFIYFQTAANLKNLNAMCNLVVCYAQGEGTQRDMKAAFSWLLRAITEGNLESLGNLFLFYKKEPTDSSLRTFVKTELHILAEKTSKTHNDNVIEAINGNAILQTLGDCCFLDEEYQEAFSKYQQGEANGSPYCTARLGECYEQGKGVEKDVQKAIYFYSKALTISDTIENELKAQYSDLTKFEGVMQLKINDCRQSLLKT